MNKVCAHEHDMAWYRVVWDVDKTTSENTNKSFVFFLSCMADISWVIFWWSCNGKLSTVRAVVEAVASVWPGFSGIIISTFFQGSNNGELQDGRSLSLSLSLSLSQASPVFVVEFLSSSGGDLSVLQMHACTVRVLYSFSISPSQT